jgi:glycosyltransferase involved in cell wall biosynthesis
MSEAIGTPLVSIGVPVYNGARSIGQALDHLLAQTYMHLELVICDNASTDDTGAICQEYAARDARVRYYRNPTNVGLINNFRLAVKRSTGPYFTWAAIDDRKLPTAIEACVRVLQARPAAVMVHGIVLVQSPGRDDLVPFPNAVDLTMPDTAARIRAFTAGITHNAIFYSGLYRLEAIRQGHLGDRLGATHLATRSAPPLRSTDLLP